MLEVCKILQAKVVAWDVSLGPPLHLANLLL